jgi:hypothetical protein
MLEMSEHTKEPWRVEATDGQVKAFYIHAENARIAKICVAPTEDIDEGNASRIVDCVTYCKGIDSDRIKSDMEQGVNAKDQIDAYDIVRKQRDELLAALKSAKAAIKGREHTGFIDSAIAKVEQS